MLLNKLAVKVPFELKVEFDVSVTVHHIYK